jgi:glyoxylase-like metal-dependent hydrolase (beta-lactamase superfamily II)
MLNIYPVIVGPIETNCYLVANAARETIIIDPGAEPEVIMATLEREDLKPVAILITHGHYDHILAAPTLGQHYTIPIWYPEKDNYLLPAEKTVGILPKDFELPNVHYYDGTLMQEHFSIEVIHTPGHTKGQSCFLIEDNLFSGDMLFAEGYLGRTDLWGGSAEDIQSSLKKLLTLANEVKVFPGHGQASTIGIERGYHE